MSWLILILSAFGLFFIIFPFYARKKAYQLFCKEETVNIEDLLTKVRKELDSSFFFEWLKFPKELFLLLFKKRSVETLLKLRLIQTKVFYHWKYVNEYHGEGYWTDYKNVGKSKGISKYYGLDEETLIQRIKNEQQEIELIIKSGVKEYLTFYNTTETQLLSKFGINTIYLSEQKVFGLFIKNPLFFWSWLLPLHENSVKSSLCVKAISNF